MGIDKVGIAPLGFADAEGKNCKLATAEDRSAKIRIVANAICFIRLPCVNEFCCLKLFCKIQSEANTVERLAVKGRPV